MFTYAEAEARLANLYEADAVAQKGAFRARLKHLKRLGVPLGSNPGSGSKILYSEDQLFQWSFCLELEQFGVDPKLIVSILTRFWSNEILPAYRMAASNPHEPTMFFFSPEFMSSRWNRLDYRNIPDVEGIAQIGWRSWSSILEVFADPSRLAIINLSRAVTSLLGGRTIEAESNPVAGFKHTLKQSM